MTREIIPILPEAPVETARSGNALPLLREIAEHLHHLLETGEASTIDLSALPLTPGDLEWLRAELGGGEVSVTLHADGASTLDETAFPGVWWIIHRNAQGAVTTQFIEVAFVPELVKSPRADVAAARAALVLRMADL
ncbi:hypothetical protein Tbd_1379 [Thiobacillus denitrificans ATCC 25259]|uniref:HupH hydrogenase expression protein C-terminal domain-containing protein n=2 Tax=Thiobacillus denitrificans (strain ATCC 25259 / T1) TaxID=292415 RepID=Q3SJ38_THIDA|nr:hydrogenase expression/formation protein [Thiobacillus denitrificans]AAZ97332.1 hypothetical protein Tbd_1379 [Thiobacillus denitrificans ATCC 25259]